MDFFIPNSSRWCLIALLSAVSPIVIGWISAWGFISLTWYNNTVESIPPVRTRPIFCSLGSFSISFSTVFFMMALSTGSLEKVSSLVTITSTTWLATSSWGVGIFASDLTILIQL